MFERCHTKHRKRSINQHTKYFRSLVQLDHPYSPHRITRIEIEKRKIYIYELENYQTWRHNIWKPDHVRKTLPVRRPRSSRVYGNAPVPPSSSASTAAATAATIRRRERWPNQKNHATCHKYLLTLLYRSVQPAYMIHFSMVLVKNLLFLEREGYYWP